MGVGPFLHFSIRQKCPQSSSQSVAFSQLAFPNGENTPSGLAKGAAHLCITLPIAFTFGLPEVGVCDWCHASKTTPVHMPEASMHKDCLPQPRQNNVRFSGETGDMQPITKPHSVDHASHMAFRVGVLAPYSCHAPMPLFRCQYIGHTVIAKVRRTVSTNCRTVRTSILATAGYILWSVCGTTRETDESRISASCLAEIPC